MGKKRPRTEASSKTDEEHEVAGDLDAVAVANNLILSVLRDDTITSKMLISKKELKRAIKSKNNNRVPKKSIKNALKHLIKSGTIECRKDGKKRFYAIVDVHSESEDDDDSESSNSDDDSVSETNDTPAAVPIAMRLRGEEDVPEKQPKKSVKFQDDDDLPENIDDEIARLERELANDDNDDDSDSEDDEEDDDDISEEEGNTKDPPQEMQPEILSLSKFSADHVEHLPAADLPEPGRYDTDGATSKKKKKRKVTENKNSNNSKSNSGLEQAVKEVLQGYQARSSERLPFYCRFCAKQYDGETEFLNHKSSEFHKAAAEAERKATYCKLCRLQLTSPVQMKEHLKSKPHKQRLHSMQQKNGGRRMSHTINHNHRHGMHTASRGGGRHWNVRR